MVTKYMYLIGILIEETKVYLPFAFSLCKRVLPLGNNVWRFIHIHLLAITYIIGSPSSQRPCIK